VVGIGWWRGGNHAAHSTVSSLLASVGVVEELLGRLVRIDEFLKVEVLQRGRHFDSRIAMVWWKTDVG